MRFFYKIDPDELNDDKYCKIVSEMRILIDMKVLELEIK